MELAFTELKDREEELEYMKRFNEEQIELHKQNTEYKDEEQAVGNYFKKENEK